MRKKLKNLLKRGMVIGGPVMRFFIGFFFPKKYLVGRHFDGGYVGWVWAIKGIWFQRFLGFNRYIPWPAHYTIKVANVERIYFHPDDINIFQSPGVYFQSLGADIVIGKGAYIAPNVGIITANHDPNDLDQHLEGKAVIIGDRCWIGMNSIILPGVTVGDGSIVGAGSVVTKSLPAGCVAAGNPARVIKMVK